MHGVDGRKFCVPHNDRHRRPGRPTAPIESLAAAPRQNRTAGSRCDGEPVWARVACRGFRTPRCDLHCGAGSPRTRALVQRFLTVDSHRQTTHRCRAFRGRRKVAVISPRASISEGPFGPMPSENHRLGPPSPANSRARRSWPYRQAPDRLPNGAGRKAWEYHRLSAEFYIILRHDALKTPSVVSATCLQIHKESKTARQHGQTLNRPNRYVPQYITTPRLTTRISKQS